MARITTGREIATTDAERVSAELRLFESVAAQDILTALSEAVKNSKTGWIRPNIRLTSGKITCFQLQIDFVKDLDGHR